MKSMDETTLTKGRIRKLNALRRLVGDELGEEAFSKWLAQQKKSSAARRAGPVAEKIEEALAGFVGDRSFTLDAECLRIVSRVRIGQIGSFSIRCYRHGTIDGKCGAQHNAGIAVEDMHAPSCVG